MPLFGYVAIRDLESLSRNIIDLFGFPQYRSGDNTLRNCSFQILSNSSAYLRIICEKTKSQVPLGPLLRKQNIQAKEVYYASSISCRFHCPAVGKVPVQDGR